VSAATPSVAPLEVKVTLPPGVDDESPEALSRAVEELNAALKRDPNFVLPCLRWIIESLQQLER